MSWVCLWVLVYCELMRLHRRVETVVQVGKDAVVGMHEEGVEQVLLVQE